MQVESDNKKQEELEILIALILIRNINSCDNSYQLTRLLSWRFGIINIVKIMNDLTVNHLIDITRTVNGTRYFKINAKGINLLDKYGIKNLEEVLELNFKEEIEFIKVLFG